MSLTTRVGSLLWSSGSKIARVLADVGALHAIKLDGYVISVGNLQAGGAGKTPLVAQIAREAIAKKKSVCILTRGYGSESEAAGAVLRPQGKLPKKLGKKSSAQVLEILNPKKFGDEAVLLRDLVPEAWIAIGADRIKQYHEACRHHQGPFDVVVLDDGFQHWKILKDRDVLAVTSHSPSDTFHRDFVGEANRADLLVWTKGETPPDAMGLFGKPTVKVRYALDISDADRSNRYWLISAIGDAESFRQTVESSGLNVARETKLSDHADFSRAQIEKWLTEARAKNLKIAVTGKDWVKWRAFTDLAGSPESTKSPKSKDMTEHVSVFEPKLIFETGRDAWDRVLWS
jgi:tetraacyldisaccharide 4'-kinase